MISSSNILVVLCLLSLSIVSIAGPLTAKEHQALDGNVYATILDGKNDTITFRDGLLHSKLYTSGGHDKVEYTTMAQGTKVRFKATSVVPNEGEFMWTGIIEGNSINGSYVYTKKGWFLFGDTTQKKYFQGSLKAE